MLSFFQLAHIFRNSVRCAREEAEDTRAIYFGNCFFFDNNSQHCGVCFNGGKSLEKRIVNFKFGTNIGGRFFRGSVFRGLFLCKLYFLVFNHMYCIVNFVQ